MYKTKETISRYHCFVSNVSMVTVLLFAYLDPENVNKFLFINTVTSLLFSRVVKQET